MSVIEIPSTWTTLEPTLRREKLRELAASARLVRAPEGLMVLRWDDVRGLLRDRRFSGVGLAVFDVLGIGDGPLRRWYGSLMFTNEGAVHHRLRSLVQQAFVPRSVEALRPTAAAFADELLRPVAAAGHGDLVDLAFHLPIRTMARLIGIPDAHVSDLTGWSKSLGPVFGFMAPEQIDAAANAIVDMLEYTKSVLAQRRTDPKDDLVTRLLDAEEGGERLTDDEVADMVVNLVAGGHDTSTGQIACTLLTMLEHPDVLATVRADPTLVPAAVEESLRYIAAIGVVPRVVLETFEYEGLQFSAGELVLLSTDTANHDPLGYSEPGRFLPQRFAADDVHRLMTFGAGSHYCLGAALARMVLEESVAAVLRLPEPLTLAEPAGAIPWVTVLGTYPGRLPITCGP